MSADAFFLGRESFMKFLLASMKSLTNCENIPVILFGSLFWLSDGRL
jgi:hypothetical protein